MNEESFQVISWRGSFPVVTYIKCEMTPAFTDSGEQDESWIQNCFVKYNENFREKQGESKEGTKQDQWKVG